MGLIHHHSKAQEGTIRIFPLVVDGWVATFSLLTCPESWTIQQPKAEFQTRDSESMCKRYTCHRGRESWLDQAQLEQHWIILNHHIYFLNNTVTSNHGTPKIQCWASGSCFYNRGNQLANAQAKASRADSCHKWKWHNCCELNVNPGPKQPTHFKTSAVLGWFRQWKISHF